MRKKLKKLCALVLSAVTVLSVLPSSGLVSAETDADITAEESVQSTVYLKVPNPSGQVIVTSNVDTDKELIQAITVDKEKITLTDNDGNTSDVTLTEEEYCLELTEEVGETINLEFIASEGYEVGTYHIISDAGDENESIEEITLSDDNKYEYTFTEESQVLEVTFNAVQTTQSTTEEDVVVEEQDVSSQEEETVTEVTEPETTTENQESNNSSNETSNNDVAEEDSDEVSNPFNKINYLKQVYEEGKKNYLTSNTNSIFKNTPSTLSITSRAVGDVVYTDSLSGYRSPISITQYPPGGGYNIIKTWNEGLLGATPSTWMFCADPTKNFQAGYKTGYPATNYFSDYAIKLMGALLYWYDTNKCSGISLGDDYMFKQEIVWTIGNLDRGWYSNVLFEHGNGQTCGLGHSLYTHRDEWYYTGLQWASNNFGNVSTTATVYNDGVGGQPLIELYYTYQPTSSGYIVKTSSNTSLTSGNSNYNLTGATYNIYKSKSDAQNNKNAISGKQFKIASNSGTSNTVELSAGTYYIKEVNGSDGTGYTTSNTIYTITITAGQRNKNLTPSGGIKNTPKTAQIDLYKTPSNPVCVENNENYTLEGAVYGIYTNSSCTSLKTKATTNADGEFSVKGLALGQYWVKEISPSPGYLVDTNVYAVDARTEGSGPVRVFTVESHETPILDPDNLLLKKVDSNTNGAPEDRGTMEGAEFEVKFYGIAVDEIADGTDPASLGYQPTRTWVLKTHTTSNGSAALIFDNAFKVSGDDFYYTSSGDIAFPFGVITMKETKAPNGYLINDQVIVQKITDANGGNDSTIIDHVPTQLEDSLTLRVVKTQYDTEKVIPGVTYRWTRSDGTVNTYTTDKNGVIEFHGLTRGKHTIEEIDVPDGYAVNTNKIEFTVAQDNTITFDKEYPMSDTNGVITISLDTEGNMDVDYTNKPAPFDLMIHKVNNHNFPLEGAEFTLYSDEKCTQVVDVQVTDSNGELTFEDLIPYEEYWMKETDAPPGYRIPVNDDGSDIIWKIDVESVPVNDEFTFNVNDTAYTVHSTGSLWIDGTKADRVCNMTVVNEVGMKLPNTGSSMMILLLIAGVMLMGGAIVISRKSRKTSDNKE